MIGNSSIINHINFLYNRKRAMVAFNVQNLFQLDVLHQVAQKNVLPVMAQFSAKYISYFEKLYGFDQLIAKYQNENLFFHLDHCMDEEIIKFCIDKKFVSVMFDGSSLPVEDNIFRANKIYKYAKSKGCLLETELGPIYGVEDGFGSDKINGYYRKDDLLVFCKSAQYDMLALAIGNAHGLYNSTDQIKIEKLSEAKKLVGKQFFVLHGGTGMPDKMIEEAINQGVIKINVSTALKIEHFNLLQGFVKSHSIYDEIQFYNYFSKRMTSFFESFILKYTA